MILALKIKEQIIMQSGGKDLRDINQVVWLHSHTQEITTMKSFFLIKKQ